MDASFDFIRRIVPETSTGFIVPTAAPPSFNPTTLFPGLRGGWWDPSDMSTLWQDNGRTTQVTAAGQTVGAMDDKSGNGNNVLQATPGKRPTLRNSGSLWWLEFVAANDTSLLTTILAFDTDVSSDVMAFQNVTWGNGATFWDGSTGNLGRVCGLVSSPEIATFCSGAGPTDTTNMTVGANHVVTAIWNGASGGSLAVDNNSYNTGGSFGGNPNGITFGNFGGGGGSGSDSLFFGGIRIQGIMTAPNIASCRTFFGSKAGLSL